MGDDVDLFRIVLPTASDLTVMTTGNTDTFGSLLDIEGNVLEVDGFQLFDDNTGPGFNFRLQARLPAGTYFVEVLGSDEFEAGRYFLRITSP